MKVSTTTCFDESKYEIIGVVDALTTRAISEFRQYFASFGSIFGGQNDLLNTKFLRARDDVINQMKQKAIDLDADLLIGINVTMDPFNMGGGEFITFSGLATALRLKAPVLGGKRNKTFRKRKH